MVFNFFDSNGASYNIINLVTLSTFSATYLVDIIFNISIFFCFMLTLHSTKQTFHKANWCVKPLCLEPLYVFYFVNLLLTLNQKNIIVCVLVLGARASTCCKGGNKN